MEQSNDFLSIFKSINESIQFLSPWLFNGAAGGHTTIKNLEKKKQKKKTKRLGKRASKQLQNKENFYIHKGKATHRLISQPNDDISNLFEKIFPISNIGKISLTEKLY